MQYDPPYMEIHIDEAEKDFKKLLYDFSYAKQFEHKDIKIEVKHKFLDFSETKEIDEKSVVPDPDYDRSYLENQHSRKDMKKQKQKRLEED